MALKFLHGDLFKDDAEALVNTVNCVGVMGKGVALKFKQLWPENYRKYKEVCERNELYPGKLLVVEEGDMINGRKLLVNFPTKEHWKAKSKLEYVEKGLDALVKEIQGSNIKSIAMPPLGCGNGGLEWKEVRKIIVQKLSGLNDVDIRIYAPAYIAIDEPEYTLTGKPNLTKERAIILRMLGELEEFFDYSLTKLCLQKLVYFLNLFDYQFNVEFKKEAMGPYSSELNAAFLKMDELGWIKGYNEEGADKISVPSGIFSECNSFIQAEGYEDDVSHTIDKISKLIQGFESPFGMELLSTVHYLGSVENVSKENMFSAVQSWSDRKKGLFSQKEVEEAYSRLSEDEFWVVI